MIKGVNRQFVEVNNTESPFFDRVLFVLSTNAAEKTDKDIENEVQRIITAYDLKNTSHHCAKRKNKFRSICKFFATAAIGGLITFIITQAI